MEIDEFGEWDFPIHDIFQHEVNHQQYLAAHQQELINYRRMAEAAMKRLYGALRSAPTYNGEPNGITFRTFSCLWKNWKTLAWLEDDTVNVPHDTRKRILVSRIEGRAVQRLTAYMDGTAHWTNAATEPAYLEVIRGVYQPASESDLSRTEFKMRKQGIKETVLDYVTQKIALFEAAYNEDERSFTTLCDAVIEGLFNTVIKRLIQRDRPANQAALIEKLLSAVASERTCVMSGYGESPSLDGLALSSAGFNPSTGTTRPGYDSFGDELMDVGKMGDSRKCYKCGRAGHMRDDCRVPKHKWIKKPGAGAPKRGNQGRGGAKKDKSKIVCYNCSKTGHYSRECQQPKRSGGGKGGVSKVDDGQSTSRGVTDGFTPTDPFAPEPDE